MLKWSYRGRVRLAVLTDQEIPRRPFRITALIQAITSKSNTFLHNKSHMLGQHNGHSLMLNLKIFELNYYVMEDSLFETPIIPSPPILATFAVGLRRNTEINTPAPNADINVAQCRIKRDKSNWKVLGIRLAQLLHSKRGNILNMLI